MRQVDETYEKKTTDDIHQLTEELKVMRKELSMALSRIQQCESQILKLSKSSKLRDHPKLSKLPIFYIKPLSLELVRDNLDSYTYEEFLKGEKGLLRFIKSLIVNSVGEKNYVCTDISRDKFYRLIGKNKWVLDQGGKFIKTIFDELARTVDRHYLTYTAEETAAVKDIDRREQLVIIKDTFRLVLRGVTETGEQREELFRCIRNALAEDIAV